MPITRVSSIADAVPLLEIEGESVATRSSQMLNLVTLYKEARPSVVRVTADHGSKDWTGTGFAITQDGAIVTDLHVIDGCKNIKVIAASGQSYPARVLLTDRQSDLAILKVEHCFKPIKLNGRTTQPDDYDGAVSIGYPAGKAELYASPGSFRSSQLLRDVLGRLNGGVNSGEDPDRLVYDERMRVEPGESGAPVYSASSKDVVAIVEATDSVDTAVTTPVREIFRTLAKNSLELPPDCSALRQLKQTLQRSSHTDSSLTKHEPVSDFSPVRLAYSLGTSTLDVASLAARKGRLFAGVASVSLGTYDLIQKDVPALWRAARDHDSNAAFRSGISVTSDSLLIAGGALLLRGKVVPGALVALTGAVVKVVEQI